jgi:hypothetical protein
MSFPIMSDGVPRLMTPVIRAGAIAREVLTEEGEVRVVAAFERTVYLACPRGIVCLGMAGLGAGPINAEVALDARQGWIDAGVMLDEEGQSAGSKVGIGDLVIDVTSGTTWLPPPFPTLDASTVSRGLARLHAVAQDRLPDQGLAGLVLLRDPGASRSAIHRAAAGPIAALRQSLPDAMRKDAWTAPALRAATLLVGLGPGFTPSGDDLLGGLMLALTAAGREGLRDALWHALEHELDHLTTPPSAMHLSAAADGMGSEPVHLLVNDVSSGGTPALGGRLDTVARIGHTSGWDALAGIVLGLEASVAVEG